MRSERRKKKKKDEDPILLKEAEKILEKSIEAAFFQAMATIEKEWIKKGGTVSNK